MRKRLVCSFALLLTSCGLFGTKPEDPWWTELEPDSVCYDVDLLDGLDETSTAELRGVFDCINQRGQFDSLVPTMDSLELQTRNGIPAGVEVARAINTAPDVDIDLFAILDVARRALEAPERPITDLEDIFLELTYGVPAKRVRDGWVTQTDPEALQQGLLVPLAPVIPEVAGALLDDDLETAAFVGDLLPHPETKRWIRTAGAWADSEDEAVRAPADDLPQALGMAIVAAHDDSNDRWSGASGDSLRDVAVAFTEDDLIGELAPEANAILGDPVVRTRVIGVLEEQYDQGHLQELLPQAKWLASVDRDGHELSAGEDSALVALVRLFHDTNQPMICSLDLWFTDLEVDLGNLAVAILDLMAEWDPDDVQGVVGLIGEIIGGDLTSAILDDIAESGLCDALTPQVASDLQAIDLLGSPATNDLVHVLIEALQAVKHGQDGQSHIPAVADLVSDVHASGAMLPTEELLRDLADGPLVEDVVDLVPILANPADYDLTAGDEPAVDLEDALDLSTWVFREEDGRTGWERIEPLVEPIVEEDGTWVAIEHAGLLLSDPESTTAGAIDLVPALLEADPDLVLLDQAGPLLGDERLAGPLLAVAETQGVCDAALAVTPTGEDPEVPLAFGARLITGGTLDDVVSLVDTVMDALNAE